MSDRTCPARAGAAKERTGRSRLAAFVLVTVVAAAISSQVVAQTYDVVINNGRVMDPETNFDGVRNVGIKDGKLP